MPDQNLFKNADFLVASANAGYGGSPIPNSRDQEISNLIEAWMALNESERRVAAESINEQHRPTLLAYSERMATEGVRRRSTNCLLLGVIAQGLDGWRTDWRENVMLLSVHYDACLRIGISPTRVFNEASKWLPPDVNRSMHAFLGRSSEDRSLSSMGYTASKDPDGFRYQRNW